jgi:hypothetical protein
VAAASVEAYVDHDQVILAGLEARELLGCREMIGVRMGVDEIADP